MKLESLVAAAAIATAGAALLAPDAAVAQAKEQFFPVLSYRTGAYGPNGAPWANGHVDYLKLVNAKGGINGVKIAIEECETGYDTARGVECYERLKGKHGGATVVQPLSTGITFALTDKAPIDKIPLITAGYGRSESQDGLVFTWNFPLAGTYWVGADVLVQHVAKKEGGFDKLKGKKITLVYHDSPYGKEPIPLLQERAKLHGFDVQLLPVTHPGVEQKATWLQIRQSRPDYVFLWGWGVMNSVALKEAQATGFPRDKMYGVWWSAAEPDVKDVGAGAKGYSALALQHGAEPNSKVVKDMLAMVHDKGQGTGPKDEVGSVLYMRGLISAMLGVEGVRQAQERYGKGKVMTVSAGGLWRWSFLPDSLSALQGVYPRLWAQIIRWLVYDSDFLPGQDITFRSERTTYQPGERVRFVIRTREVPLDQYQPRISLQPPQGEPELITPTRVADSGDFVAYYTPVQEGAYRATLQNNVGTPARDESRFTAYSDFEETRLVSSDPQLMAHIARQTGGEPLTLDQLGTLPERARAFAARAADTPRLVDAWDNGLVLACLFGILGLEWLLRRARGAL